MDLDRAFTRVNPLIAGILRAPVLHWLLSPTCMLLTITGRKSGRRYTIPVGYQRYGDDLITLVSKARRKSWWRNFREPWPVRIYLCRRSYDARGALVPAGSEEFRLHADRTFRRLPWLGRQFGIGYDRATGLTDDHARCLARDAAIVRFSFATATEREVAAEGATREVADDPGKDLE
jgi:hypothetical protein